MNTGDRWDIARRLWAHGVNMTAIAAGLNLSVKAFRVRVQKWRRNPATANWFPPR
jgi:hypothetical protein